MHSDIPFLYPKSTQICHLPITNSKAFTREITIVSNFYILVPNKWREAGTIKIYQPRWRCQQEIINRDPVSHLTLSDSSITSSLTVLDGPNFWLLSFAGRQTSYRTLKSTKIGIVSYISFKSSFLRPGDIAVPKMQLQYLPPSAEEKISG